jgi:hypothetical protein
MTTKLKFIFPAISMVFHAVSAQNVQLHVNDRWKECSFQIDPSLTQQEWHEFAQEAGMVACFRPVTSAKPMGVGRFDISALQWSTYIDETKGAWNNTFVHPDAEHYLVGGPKLSFPGLTARVGLTDKLDAGVYWTMRPGANYGFWGAQVQYNFLNADNHAVDLSSRLGFNRVYGPEDLNFGIYAIDVVASRKFNLYKDWVSVSPYAGLSAYLSHAHEKTGKVDLADENVLGMQGMVGAVVAVRNFSIAAEYNQAKVNSYSFRLGYSFGLWSAKTN